MTHKRGFLLAGVVSLVSILGGCGAVPDYAYLQITSIPPATVYQNGRRIDETPMSLPYEITPDNEGTTIRTIPLIFFREGYIPVEREFHLSMVPDSETVAPVVILRADPNFVRSSPAYNSDSQQRIRVDSSPETRFRDFMQGAVILRGLGQ